ncbi:hypothetical protein tb265_33200 [Gemmatimonadetes bacterium T265]|nr:hypothetical protein tb265_33200 [Gemmatimonadetes bacterium T265]
MAHLVEVAFKGNRKEFYAWSADDPPAVGAAVIVEGDRGEDLGRVHATGALAAKRYAGVAHGALALVVDGAPAGVASGEAAPSKRVLRAATAEELARAGELPALDEDARRTAIARVRAHGLAMKLTDAEWQWDRRKLTLYFTAEKRVDFRALVRDLAAIFRARIELKQIGVRDEAKRLTGVGRCGREYCSATWLPELRPVNLTVAKDQRLSLNPTQISGACGRLMCSLRYEHEFYVQQRKRFPKEGRVLATAHGEEKVVATDIFRERVTLRGLDGETRVVPLDELRREVADASSAPAPEHVSTAAGAAPDGPAMSDVVVSDVVVSDVVVSDVVVSDVVVSDVVVSDVVVSDVVVSDVAATEVVPSDVVVQVAAATVTTIEVADVDVATPAAETPAAEAAPAPPGGDAPANEAGPARRRGRRGGRRGRGGP